MAAKKSDERGAREAKKRLNNYQARQSIHAKQVSRRTRDNWIAGVVGVVVVALAVGGQLLYFNGGPGTAPEPTATTTPSPTASSTAEPSAEPSASAEASGDVPSSSLAEDRTWEGSMDLGGIPVTFELDGKLAPQAVSSFVSLTEDKFYDNLTCHRLTTSGIFVLQCGDPNGDGTGGPGYSYGPVENAPADDVYAAGTIAMARQSGNAESQGSQFFIVYEDSTIPSDAAGGYTVVGKITGGLDEITSTIVAGGVEGGAGDGVPTVETVISDFTLE